MLTICAFRNIQYIFNIYTNIVIYIINDPNRMQRTRQHGHTVKSNFQLLEILTIHNFAMVNYIYGIEANRKKKCFTRHDEL